MAEDIDAAFDVFVSSRLVTWINGRIGDGQWDRNLLDGPQLDREISPGVIVDVQGRWYRPEFAIVANDPAFSFAARQTIDVDDDGDPWNRATLTLTLSADAPAGIPADGVISTQIPIDLIANLTVPTIAADGTTIINTVHGNVSGGDNAYIVTFELKGAEVIATYVHLTQHDPNVPGGVVLQIIASHLGIQPAWNWPARIEVPIPMGMLPSMSIDLPGPSFNGLQFMMVGPEGQRFGQLPQLPFGGPVPSTIRYLPIMARYDRTVEPRLAFYTDRLRNRFTITRNDMTRPIIDANDLSEFAGPRSEYRELTSLGTVSARYPSLQRLYLGQVSGTVVAVPAAYGIQRTPTGLAASCDAIVDAASITGSKFHFTFEVAPMADPVELAQLAVDVVNTPEAEGRTLQVTLPTGLDAKNSSTLDAFPSALAGFASAGGSAVQVSVDIADDQSIPSTTMVNQFLHQLGAKTPAPLFGNLALRLDDMFPQLVRARLTLNLHQTADGEDLTVSGSEDGIVSVTNESPFRLALQRLAIVAGNGVTVSDLGGQTIESGQTSALPGDATNATQAAVSRNLPVPSPVPKADMLTYVTFHAVAVEQIQHPLNVNATGINFAAAGITAIEVQFALTTHPDIAVPSLTLSAAHPIDFVHALIPIVATLTGLQTTVALGITAATGRHEVSLSHDFMEDPILVLTDAAIT